MLVYIIVTLVVADRDLLSDVKYCDSGIIQFPQDKLWTVKVRA